MIALAVFIAFATRLPIEPVPPMTPPQIEQGDGIRVAVEWSGVQATPGCFFFSGPGRLGRDDQLGSTACVDPAAGRISFGSAVFRGGAGRLTRRSQHDHQGVWHADEALAGALGSDGRFSGSYAYAECAQGGACPGTCRISAAVRMTPVGRCGSGAGAPRS